MVKTPVLFETFARVDYARQVFEAIKKAKPQKFYFYCNKARPNRPEEIAANNEIRSWVKEVDWYCELKTFFRDECVDVYTSLKGAVDWVFEYEETALVLEDDCVPSQAFFDFCDQILPMYKNDLRVWFVSGCNYFEDKCNPHDYDYLFVRNKYAYGWATWRDRWNRIDWDNFDINDIIEQQVFMSLGPKWTSQILSPRYKKIDVWLHETKCWDYLFELIINVSGGLTIVPKKHLVTNIGTSGTHYKYGVKGLVNKEATADTTYEIKKHPKYFVPDYQYEKLFHQNFNTIYIRIFRRVKNIIMSNWYALFAK